MTWRRDDILATLERMRAILAQPGSWCQNALGRTGKGRPTVFLSEARARSLEGALCEARPPMPVYTQAADFLDTITGGLKKYNDAAERTHAQVLALLDAAIRFLRNPPPEYESLTQFLDSPDATLSEAARVVYESIENGLPQLRARTALRRLWLTRKQP